ncbi:MULTISPECIES: hypothetical protein [Acinetobacter]|jgi:hypothetical protein|nr:MULTISPECIES: hypothetical protein [Acinetobacter]MBC70103.1 hypothetical protein [Acinetobacter sp.]HIQ33074.1 hypothetical protein [Acinetobacter venetianus]|tara:strand:- start:827 stop:1201 length:375 start_codon:yes stop_codon:yes gene_type:complete
MMTEFNSKNFVELYQTLQGQELWRFLNTEKAIIQMKTASDLNKPALLGIEKDLLRSGLMQTKEQIESLGIDGKIYDRTKQMLGAMVRQIMESEGYKLHSKNMRVVTSSKIFYAATLYREIEDKE